MKQRAADFLKLICWALFICCALDSAPSAADDFRSALAGKMYTCSGFLYQIKFNSDGGVVLLYQFAEVVERIPPSNVIWRNSSVSFRAPGTVGQGPDQSIVARLYLGAGPRHELLADVSGEGVLGGEEVSRGRFEIRQKECILERFRPTPKRF